MFGNLWADYISRTHSPSCMVFIRASTSHSLAHHLALMQWTNWLLHQSSLAVIQVIKLILHIFVMQLLIYHSNLCVYKCVKLYYVLNNAAYFIPPCSNTLIWSGSELTTWLMSTVFISLSVSPFKDNLGGLRKCLITLLCTELIAVFLSLLQRICGRSTALWKCW